MLKACLECLVGGTRTEEPNTIHLNGQNLNRAPPWPQPQQTNEKMFLLPKILAPRDQMIVKGETNRRDTLAIGLVTGYNGADYQNVACQVDVNFTRDVISIKVIENGVPQIINEDNSASDFFVGKSSNELFDVGFKMRDGGYIDIHVGGSNLETIALKHDIANIRYLTVYGDVNRVTGLDFQFG